MARRSWIRLLLVACTAAAVGLLALHGPIPQDPAYHAFADTRTLAGIPNFWNVVSNLPFLLVALHGAARVPRLAVKASIPAYVALCIGVAAVAFGSGGYHLAPENASLVWDRLPMTIAFVAFLSLLLDERVFDRPRPAVLAALVLAGIGSVAYWSWTEARGVGDLRPYVLVQFLPIVLIPLILLLPSRHLATRPILLALAGYALAKVLEHFDAALFAALGGAMGGHAVKHVAAALAVLCILHAVPVRPARAAG